MHKLMIVGLIATGAAWPMSLDAGFIQDFEWKGRIERGKTIEVKGVLGDVMAERASGNEVEVTARKHSRRSDEGDVRIEVIEHSGGVTICAVYPSRSEDRPNECRAGPGGRMNTHKNDVNVDFRVRVPAGVNFVGKTVNGDVDALDMRGDVFAHTVNGSVDLATNGLAEASTVNGSITVSMGRADWDGELEFNTVNGSVRLELPSELDCELEVATVNGQIASDYAITVSGRFSPRHLKGIIGKGGRELNIKTVNGSVELRRL